MIQLPDINLGGILPPVILCVAGLAILIVGLFVRKWSITVCAIISLVGIVLAGVANGPLRTVNREAFSGLVAVDSYTWFFNLLILIAAGLTVLISEKYLADDDLRMPEYFVLLLFASAGMMFMVSGNHLLTIFVGLETLSISVYILTGILPGNPKSSEGALKYLVLGGFSSAVFLYGAALLYGSTGSLALPGIMKHLQTGPVGTLAYIGMGLLLIGFAFKIAAVPFHMWTPDAYEGAPTPITGFMSVGVKAAAFAAFLRVFFDGLPTLEITWVQILWGLAFVTMILGNLVALTQDNIKRMLAYSSIAHAGYILVGMVAGTERGTAGVLYYLLAYTFTNIGAFGVVALVGRKGEANVSIDDYRGLANMHPLLAIVMAIFMFSLAGLPPTAGFVGKFAIFGAAVAKGYVGLVVVGVLTSAASVFYYFRVIMKMYMEASDGAPSRLEFSPSMMIALGIAVVAVLYIGIFPTTYLNLAIESVKPLF